jgi:tripartite-type tricarboxylate transporter receptor subunit TctC
MKRTIASTLAAATLATWSGLAAAQAFPAKPVKVLVPFGAGGVADITARVVAQKMGDTLGQQVVVENRPSAGGIVAAEAVAKSDPDGHTLFLVSNGAAVSATLFRTLPFDTVRDFAPISTLGFFDIAVLVNGESKINTIGELLAWAKANPGKLSIGSINIGSTQHLSAELFRSMSGADGLVVPFKGTPAVITALRANDVQVAFEILAPVIAQVKGGTLRAIGVAGEKRFPGLPNVPTVAESGVPGYFASSWNGLSAPAKTPRAVVERLNKEVNAAVASPEVKNRLLELGVDARAGSTDALQKLLVAEIAKWGAVIERAKIEKQ